MTDFRGLSIQTENKNKYDVALKLGTFYLKPFNIAQSHHQALI